MALGKNLVTKNTSEDTSDKQALGSSIKTENSTEHRDEGDPNGEDTLKKYEQFCVFKEGKEEYAIPIGIVKEVVPIPQISKVPQMPSYVIGMANVRGNIFGIMDLGVFFKQEGTSEKKYLLVLNHDLFQMGLVIPSVPDTMIVEESTIEKLTGTKMKSKIGQKYLKGIIKKDNRMIILFDILGMISSDQFTVVA